MVHVLGVDTHKDTLAAAVDAQGRLLECRTVPNDPAGYASLATWAAAGGAARIGINSP